jgi:lipopolysaccharide biosynthesis glycosyltransferase
MNRELNVVFTIDDKFVQHFSVTLVSLLENNKDITFKLYVIHDIVDPTLLNTTLAFVERKYGVGVNLITISSSVFSRFRTNLHYSKAVYFRLMLTELIPLSVEKLLFLDADTVITGSLHEMADYQFRNLMVLGVSDHGFEGHIERLNKMGFPVTRYFNAGVLLINLKGWRQKDAAHDLMQLADQYMDKLAWWDQDLLNMYFFDSWDYMDSKYNSIGEVLPHVDIPTVIHYSGPFKPWLYLHNPPYKKLYWDYLKLTPFSNADYPDLTLKNILVKKYYKLKQSYFPEFKMPPFVFKCLGALRSKNFTANVE